MYCCVAFKNMAIAGSKSTWFKSSGKILPSFEIFSLISLYKVLCSYFYLQSIMTIEVAIFINFLKLPIITESKY